MAPIKGNASKALQDRTKKRHHKGNLVETARPARQPLPPVVADRQQRNKGGLLVTGELQTAIQKCKEKVERMAADCRRGNRKFRDIEFDFIEDKDRCLHALSPEKPKYTPSDVLRVTQIFDNPQLFVDGATASDIQQGAIGDCWFLSAMAVVAAAGLIERVCVAKDEQVGIYGFIFWRDGGWVNVIIDDLLFTRVPQWGSLSAKEQLLYHQDKDSYNKTARKGGKSLYFARSLTPNETWVPLLEKAFAKLHGDYAALEGGFTHEAIEDLTGAVSQLIYTKDILDPDQFWKDQLLRANHDRLFACFTPSSSSTSDEKEAEPPLETNGLVNGHAYSITKAVEYRGKRFVRVRNPWGRYEWTGRWSDGSKEWTGEWLDALKALGHTFGNDGEFIMEYSDFLETWEAIEVAQLFDSTWAISQQWLKVDAGDSPKAWNFGDVSYTVSIPNPTHAIIVLAQLDWRFFEELRGHYMWSFDFVIYKKGEEEEYASSIHSTLWDRSVKMEVDLDAGDYVVHVRLDRALFRERGYSQKADEWGIRKYSRKRAEYLLSNSIALNFAAREYGPTLPLSREMFTGKHDLTELELSLHESLLEHKAKVLEAFAPHPPHGEEDGTDGDESKGEGDWVTDEESKTEDGKATEEEGRAKGGSKVEAGTQTKDEAKEKDEPASGGGASRDARPGIAEVLPKKFDLDFHPDEPKPDDDKDEKKDGKDGEGKDGDENVTKEEVAEIVKEAVGDADSEDNGEHPESGPAEESNFFCDGCKKPITAGRYHCLDAACVDYDLCDDCIQIGAHAEDHKLLHIPTEKDGSALAEGNEDMSDNNSVILGLRVYTNKDSPAVIKGQLRHAHVVRHALTYSKII